MSRKHLPERALSRETSGFRSGLQWCSFSSYPSKDGVYPSSNEQSNVASTDLHPVLRNARLASTSDHLELDKKHLWHPYTSLVSPPPVLPVKHAADCTLVLEDGSQLLDGMSSWWAAVWGYNHPSLNKAAEEQISKMSHVMFGGLTHRPATELASILLHMLGNDKDGDSSSSLSKIFYTDSGSVAVEVALKMALQYHRGVDTIHNKTRIVSVRGGYHGDTLHAMSVCDPVNGMHTAFQGVVPQHVVFVQRPPCHGAYRVGAFGSGCSECSCQERGEEQALKAAMDDLQVVMEEQHESIAAMILEPIVQGAGGMRFYSPKYLQRARELCDEYNVLLICDEIATGFGRSSSGTAGSHLFASFEAGIQPDIICLGKALTGGYLTLGAVVTTEKVARGVSSSPAGKENVVPLPLMHGPTFMGNPLACAVAVASTNLMLQPDPDSGSTSLWKSNVSRIEQELRSNLQDAAAIPGVADVRVRGAIGVIELERPIDNSKVSSRCHELGVWLRPFGTLLYTMPPYVMTNQELKKVTDAMMVLAEENGA
jgi:adenosylmethionine-8-amino-7-oxononanoate aminotransferase